MGPFLSKNSDQKRVFWKNEFDRAFDAKLSKVFSPGHFCPRTHHIANLASKTGEVRFSTKIQTENVYYGMDETLLRDTFTPNRAI